MIIFNAYFWMCSSWKPPPYSFHNFTDFDWYSALFLSQLCVCVNSVALLYLSKTPFSLFIYILWHTLSLESAPSALRPKNMKLRPTIDNDGKNFAQKAVENLFLTLNRPGKTVMVEERIPKWQRPGSRSTVFSLHQAYEVIQKQGYSQLCWENSEIHLLSKNHINSNSIWRQFTKGYLIRTHSLDKTHVTAGRRLHNKSIPTKNKNVSITLMGTSRQWSIKTRREIPLSTKKLQKHPQCMPLPTPNQRNKHSDLHPINTINRAQRFGSAATLNQYPLPTSKLSNAHKFFKNGFAIYKHMIQKHHNPDVRNDENSDRSTSSPYSPLAITNYNAEGSRFSIPYLCNRKNAYVIPEQFLYRIEKKEPQKFVSLLWRFIISYRRPRRMARVFIYYKHRLGQLVEK